MTLFGGKPGAVGKWTMLLAFLYLLLAACDPASSSQLARSIDEIFARPEFASSVSACVVKTLDTGVTVYSRNASTLLMPASNLKLITTAAALEILGPDYRFETKLVTDGEVTVDGTLEGNLYVIASGDPLVDVPDVLNMADHIKNLGIARIKGDVIGDLKGFEQVSLGSGWAWDYLADYYAVPSSGLNFHHNVVDIIIRPGSNQGAAASVWANPGFSPLRLVNRILTGDRGNQVNVSYSRDWASGIVNLTGEIPLDHPKHEEIIAVNDPATYFLRGLRSFLIQRGVTVTGSIRFATSEGRNLKTLYVHKSKPVSEMVTHVNKWSDNLVAECLVRAVGAKVSGSGTFEAGRQAVYGVMEKKAGFDMQGIRMADGSGLSRLNLVSADNFIKTLEYMWKHRAKDIFVSSLPVAGQDGTLRTRLKATQAEGNVRGKTGYIGYVSSLSGYATSKAGQPLAYCIVFNNHSCPSSACRDAEDEIAALLALCAVRY